MDYKYKLTNIKYEFFGRELYRIEALRDFSDVKKGDLGGYIEKESNLSHNDDCWIYNNALIIDDSKLLDNAKIYNNAWMCNNSICKDNAKIYNNVQIHGNSIIGGNAKLLNDVIVKNQAKIYDNSLLKDDVNIYGNANVFGNSYLTSNVKLGGNTCTWGTVIVIGNKFICSCLLGNIFGRKTNNYYTNDTRFKLINNVSNANELDFINKATNNNIDIIDKFFFFSGNIDDLMNIIKNQYTIKNSNSYTNFLNILYRRVYE